MMLHDLKKIVMWFTLQGHRKQQPLYKHATSCFRSCVANRPPPNQISKGSFTTLVILIVIYLEMGTCFLAMWNNFVPYICTLQLSQRTDQSRRTDEAKKTQIDCPSLYCVGSVWILRLHQFAKLCILHKQVMEASHYLSEQWWRDESIAWPYISNSQVIRQHEDKALVDVWLYMGRASYWQASSMG